ncbi:MAG: ribonuclease HII [Candidatus Promineofilum sp.]|nr:ribonuclease HII [Promineifilum sp.]MBP9657167.1 ribonuclease HII [Promineifilum sp.]
MAIPGPASPDLSLERLMAAQYGIMWVTGADEAGRGALAGPVVAAAVLIPIATERDVNAYSERLQGVRDSKLLTAAARDRLYDLIIECVPACGIGLATAEWIDQHGIISATRQAITQAIRQLVPPAEGVLVDGPHRLADVNLPQQPVVRGDRHSLSIAAASILAKVSRDRYMLELDRRFPDYGFQRHKGYGTAEHLAALGRVGPCPEHRRSFAPLREKLV